MRTILLVILTAAALMGTSVLAGAQQDSGAKPSNLNASITLEQKARIRDVVMKESNVPRIPRADFALTIGNVVPRSVPIAPVPDPVAQAFPNWRGYGYFVIQDQVQDQIIIVNPQDHTIVAIIA